MSSNRIESSVLNLSSVIDHNSNVGLEMYDLMLDEFEGFLKGTSKEREEEKSLFNCLVV